MNGMRSDDAQSGGRKASVPRPGRAPYSPWRFVVAMGFVSMLADVVYEGSRAITGPFLESLGVSAVAVGAITGVGEAIGFAGRLGSGPLADKTRAYWPLLIVGYALTVVAVPFLGVTSVVWIVATLIFIERAGKAVRRPAKDVILSHATSGIGRGRGFAVHEALDQFGAVLGPLAVAGAFHLTHNYAPTFAMLALPGAIVMVLLLRLRKRVPDPSAYEEALAAELAISPPSAGRRAAAHPPLGRPYWWYLSFATVTTIGYSTFGVLGYHLVHEGLASTATVPVIYAGAMIVDALAALAVGALFDRVGRRVLLVVPMLAAAIPPLAFARSLPLAIAGMLVWGAVMGIQESVLRAAVADLIPSARRGTAYGIFAAAIGAAALVGGILTGGLYETHLPLLVAVIAGIQVAALVLYVAWSRGLRSEVP
ncbi:MAG TPA: MFS transporter [Demequinaceae bacterium]